MLSNLPVDLGTVGLLAFVVWLDGWRRLRPDAVVVARVGFGPWAVSAPSIRMGSLAVVAWWAPIVVPVVVERAPSGERPGIGTGDDFDAAVTQARDRLRKVRWTVAGLRVLGVVLVLCIVVGIPAATARFAGPGLLYGVLAAFGLALALALLTVVTLARLGTPVRRGIRAAAQLLSPFTAPRAAEIVTTAAVGAPHSLVSVAALLGEDRFLRWIRPWAYDEIAGSGRQTEDSPLVPLVRMLPRRVLEQAIAPASREGDNDGARYCPRCMRTYHATVEQCSECSGLALVAVSAPAIARN